MIKCPDCAIHLTDGTAQCPFCKRVLSRSTLARRVGLAVVILLPLMVVGLIALAARSIETRVLWGNTSPSVAYKAAMEYVQSAPGMKGAVNFSKLEETVVERWGPTRWRISGFADTQPAPGTKVHNLYSCVLRYDGKGRWDVEDLHFERIE